MKPSQLLHLALAVAAVAAKTAMQPRTPPQLGSDTLNVLLEQVVEGMRSWGLTNSFRPLTGNPSGPTRNMPGGLPELNRPHPPQQDGVPGTPGNPLGPQKKAGRIYDRGETCTRTRSISCSAGSVATGRTSKFPIIRANGRGAYMMALTMLSPYAREVLQVVKGWDNPISHDLAWFDEAMSSLQTAIGGGQVSAIYGNELKLWFICLLRDNKSQYRNRLDDECERSKNALSKEAIEQKGQQGIDGLNQVSNLCEKVVLEPPPDTDLRERILRSCDNFAEAVDKMIDANAGILLLGELSRAKSLNGEELTTAEVAAAETFVQKGAFGLDASNGTGTGTEAAAITEITWQYLEATSADKIVEVETDGVQLIVDHDRPAVWTELLKIRAGYVPEDRAAVNEALGLLKGTPHLREFDREPRESLRPVQACWTAASLLSLQPPRWDRLSAGIIYLEGRLKTTNSVLACAPCQTDADFWVLRCGSAVP